MVGGTGLEPVTLPIHRDALDVVYADQRTNLDCTLPPFDFVLSFHGFSTGVKPLGIDHFPRTSSCCVVRLSGVVKIESLLEVIGVTNVEATVFIALNDVREEHQGRWWAVQDLNL